MDTSDRDEDALKPKEEPTASNQDGASEDDHESENAPDPAEEPADEDKEEVSLLEPQPISKPSSQPQVVEEEPEGPNPRLVIHKLALVNFKSYAGRQVIGPFHKVCTICGFPSTLFTMIAVFFRDRGPEWLWEVEHDRRTPLRLRLPSNQDETGQALGADSQFCSISRFGRV